MLQGPRNAIEPDKCVCHRFEVYIVIPNIILKKATWTTNDSTSLGSVRVNPVQKSPLAYQWPWIGKHPQACGCTPAAAILEYFWTQNLLF